jgi:DNA-binding NarL/FixJ family response regulator
VVAVPREDDDPLGAPQPSSARPRVLIIEGEPLFLAALAHLVAAPPICGEIERSSTSENLPELAHSGIDLIVADVHAQPLGGKDLVATLERRGMRLRVVLVSEAGEEALLLDAFAAGAAGVFTRASGIDAFVEGVRAVLAGHRAMGADIVLDFLRRIDLQSTPKDPAVKRLSPTELDVLALIGQGRPIALIAEIRGISEKTVRNHLASIYRKLELRGRTEAILYAARAGLAPV